MASIQKRGSAYRVRITREGKSTLCATFYSRLEALQWAKKTEAQLRLGLYVGSDAIPKPSDGVLFEVAANHYRKHTPFIRRLFGAKHLDYKSSLKDGEIYPYLR